MLKFLNTLRHHPIASTLATLALGSTWFWKWVGRASEYQFLWDMGQKLGPRGMTFLREWGPLISLVVAVAIFVAIFLLGDKPASPSASEEVAEIRRAGELWFGEAEVAVNTLATLLDHEAEYFANRGNLFALLLKDLSMELRRFRKALGEAIQSEQSLIDVRQLLVGTETSYSNGARWINQGREMDAQFLTANDVRTESDRWSYEGWKETHAKFIALYKTLRKRSSVWNELEAPLYPDPDSLLFEQLVDSRWRLIELRPKAPPTLSAVRSMPSSEGQSPT